ncbi:MAG: DUF6036 family nucleotidyltransferase [Candidatus Njordarchaeota archaeon]
MRKNMIKVLVLVSKRRKIRTREICRILGLSYVAVLNILKSLDRMGLVKLGRGFVEAPRFLADLIVQIDSRYPLEEILRGSTPLILSRLFDPRRVKDVSMELGITEKYVRNVLNSLSMRGVVEKIDDRYVLVMDPQLRVLIMQIVRVLEGVEPEAHVIYRDNYYIIKEIPRGFKANGVPTAFSVYDKYGIPIEPNRDVYLYPPKKISVEEVIVHSLLAAKTKQEYTLVSLLYAKYCYKIDHSKLMFYAQWFKQEEKLFQLERYIWGSEEPLFLPWSELEDLARLYNIDLSSYKKKQFSEDVFREIGTRLSRETKAVLFGGAEMVIKGYKTSTKDIDIAFLSEPEIKVFIETIEALEYKQKSKNDIIVYEHKNKTRIDIYLNKIGKIPIIPRILDRTIEQKYGKLRLLFLSDTDLLLTKLISARPRDIEDAKIIIRKGNIDWKELVDTLIEEEKITKHHYCLLVLTILEQIEKELKIHIPQKRRLLKITTEHMVIHAYKEYGLRDPRDIRKLINISEETIRRILKKQKEK